MPTIAVDLTPILPGGDNGGAKIMTLNLIKQIAKLTPTYRFYLLANKINYDEIKQIKTKNINIIKVDAYHYSPKVMHVVLPFLYFLFSPFKLLIPLSVKQRIHIIIHKISRAFSIKQMSKQMPSIDLLFSPFTAPFFCGLNVPNISVIYDLQYHYYPFFFSPQDCGQRHKTFRDACKYSTKLITISNYVKETVIENSKFPSKDIQTIHIKLSKRLPILAFDKINQVLASFNLVRQQFLLFPANFWAHKNHRMLFTAFNIYRHQNPHSSLKLVCTGTNESGKKALIEAIHLMGLSSWVILPGYLSDDDFSALMDSSLAVIFPSLYEGFGMPVLEAMNAGKPVLCSNVTSLPEVAGDAALLFDPRKPDEMAHAIYRIENEPELAQTLIKNGQEHAKHFGTEVDMANEYLNVFNEVLSQKV